MLPKRRLFAFWRILWDVKKAARVVAEKVSNWHSSVRIVIRTTQLLTKIIYLGDFVMIA